MSRATIIFDGEINPENISNFIASMDEALESANDIDVYFSSFGGHVHYARLLLDYFSGINTLVGADVEIDDTGISVAPQHKRINLKAFQVVASAAFEFFVKAENCYKEVLPDTTAMVHAYTTIYDYRENIMREDSVLSLKMLEEMNATLEEFLYNCGVNKRKIKEVMGGKTVVLTEKELMKCTDEWRQTKVQEED